MKNKNTFNWLVFVIAGWLSNIVVLLFSIHNAFTSDLRGAIFWIIVSSFGFIGAIGMYKAIKEAFESL
jgi:hypothetical protein